jgi:hypothetical protein
MLTGYINDREENGNLYLVATSGFRKERLEDVNLQAVRHNNNVIETRSEDVCI